MANTYARFADVYDAYMDDFDYPAWAGHYLRLLALSGVFPKTALDAGCGTGNMTLELARRGVAVTGSDLSEAMLSRAAQKARAAALPIPFVRQDLRALALHRPVDAVVCACDGVNYLLTNGDVAAFFASANRCLKPGGALAFDVSTRAKFQRMIRDGAYCEERADSAYLWFNQKGKGEDRIDMDLTIFLRQSGGLYQRFEERHSQRAHTIDQLKALLSQSGFSTVRAYGDRTEIPPSPDDQRVHVTAIKQ
jgi:SAM-dependent methyltransferase